MSRSCALLTVWQVADGRTADGVRAYGTCRAPVHHLQYGTPKTYFRQAESHIQKNLLLMKPRAYIPPAGIVMLTAATVCAPQRRAETAARHEKGSCRCLSMRSSLELFIELHAVMKH